jgi:uncharacterized protein (UPF0332 family)
LVEAFDKRQVADYSFEEEITPKDARLQITRAKGFLREAKTWMSRQRRGKRHP